MTPYKYDIVFYGGPGAGKTTQAQLISNTLHAEHLNMGEHLRELAKKNTTLGREVKSTIGVGKLLPDKVSIAVVDNFLATRAENVRIVFDGFPRNLTQAKLLDKYLAKINRQAVLVFLELPVEIAVERLRLRGRIDDKNPVALRNRVAIFNKNSQKILEYYKTDNRLIMLNSNQTPAKTNKDLIGAIKKWR